MKIVDVVVIVILEVAIFIYFLITLYLIRDLSI